MSTSRFDYSTFTYNPDDPLARSTGESKLANQGLHDYAYMGITRSIPKLHSRYKASTTPPPTLSINTIKYWSDRFLWQSRIERWTEQERDREESEWRERRREIRQTDFDHGSKLRELFEQIISDAPNYIKTRRRTQKGTPRVVDSTGKIIQEGEPDREIVTVSLDTNLMLRAGKLASDLQRLAAEMETERTITETNPQTGLLPVDVSDMDETRYQDAIANIQRFANSLTSPGIPPGNQDLGNTSGAVPMEDTQGP